jgi:hypothetical protein
MISHAKKEGVEVVKWRGNILMFLRGEALTGL